MRLSADAMFAEDRPSDVAARSIRGSGFSFAAQGVRFALQAASTVVLARLLTPDDYGIVAMALVVVGFAQVFRDAGLSTATVQRDRITREQVESLFWVNLAVSVAIAAAVFVCAPLVAAFYHAPELTAVTAVLSTSFLVGGVAVQQDALLRRHMQFRSLAIVQVVAQVVTFALTVALALLDGGYWSLVIGSLAGSAAAALMTLYFCPFLPRRPRRGVGIRGMLLFGGHLTAFDFVNYFARTADNILVGRLLGASALGLYSRAYNLFMLPITQIRAPVMLVALPSLSALRDHPARYRSYYRRMVEAMAVLTVPIGVYCVLEGEFVVRILLGPQWMELTTTFRILAVAGIIQACVSTVGLVMVSQGRADRQLRIGLANSLVVVVGIVAGLPFGIAGVATGYVLANYVVAIPTLWYSFRGSPVRISDFARAILPPVGAAGAAAAFAFLASQLASTGSAARGLLVLAIFVAAYVALSLWRPSVRSSLRLLLRPQKAVD